MSELEQLRAMRDLVARMRELQREYFRTRDHEVLKASKAAERAVDEALKTKTPTLFWGTHGPDR